MNYETAGVRVCAVARVPVDGITDRWLADGTRIKETRCASMGRILLMKTGYP
jgi:hypothetical protein